MAVTVNGFDCVADIGTSAYAAAKTESQAKVPWAYQATYAKVLVYYGIVLVFTFSLKYAFFKFRDYQYKKIISREVPQNAQIRQWGLLTKIFDNLAAICRFIVYRRLPPAISRFTGFPMSIGTLAIFAASLLYSFCYLFIPHEWYRGCFGFGSPPLAVRAGLMVCGITPFVFILSGKCNLISAMTGVGYEKLNVYHQGVGMLSFFLSLVHTFPFVAQPIREGGIKYLHEKYLSDVYIRNGIAPLVFLLILCVCSLSGFRKRFYELFLHIHWLAAIAYYISFVIHANFELKSDNYLWATLAFWMSQLIYRAVVKTTLSPTKAFLVPNISQLKKLSGDCFEITIKKTTHRSFKWKPGQHLFIRFIGKHILDNHPFTIASFAENDSADCKLIVKAESGLTKKMFNTLSDEILFKQQKVYVDGPYGGMSRDIDAFNQVNLIASGSGVSATIPFFSMLANSKFASDINFVWIIRDISHFEWIKEAIQKAINNTSVKISVEIYVTRAKENDFEESDVEVHKLQYGAESLSEKSSKEQFDLADCIRFHYGHRPNVKDIVESFSLLKRNCFILSGSTSLRSECGNAIANLQRKVLSDPNVGEVYLHTESFGW
ncbi:hypothetical protein PACTADRAFT_2554 [Pachysolen tannophilus NRRL Y-2460]|uniref:ferric-chelate reductase (NADPH) n=1 Tax=Pachysolen tannophilus NRRL Y-2460 TaxID=669874 RepID=A0A1E4TWT9_PACTA|nr:hypothetical protein PACTADRAFT_2554 [Pachysolen tannophilus NRRL Y-2460]